MFAANALVWKAMTETCTFHCVCICSFLQVAVQLNTERLLAALCSIGCCSGWAHITPLRGYPAKIEMNCFGAYQITPRLVSDGKRTDFFWAYYLRSEREREKILVLSKARFALWWREFRRFPNSHWSLILVQCLSQYVPAWTHIHINVQTHAHMHTHIIHTDAHAQMCTHKCTCTYVTYIHIHAHIHIHKHMIYIYT
jgi:hypothetical protein